MYIYRENPRTVFDTETGYSIRYGNEKPLSPELIDLKVTNKCNSQYCKNLCYMCSNSNGEHASLQFVIDQLSSFKEFPFQIAIGGGDITTWPYINGFIAWCKSKNIVINTAVGPNCNNKVVKEITQDGVSAIGISFIDKDEFIKTLKTTWKGNSKVFAHCILREDTIQQWINYRQLFSTLDGIIFLLFKRAGNAKKSQYGLPTRKQFDELFSAFDGFNIGFDSCCYPLLKDKVPETFIDTCDGGKYSLFVDAVNKTVSKCSFLPDEFDLDKMNLQEAWNKIKRIKMCKYQY